MRRIFGLIASVLVIAALIAFTACGEKAKTPETAVPEEKVEKAEAETVAKKEVDMELQKNAEEFLGKYLDDFARVYRAAAGSYWTAANSGKKEDFDAYAAADLEMKKLHSDKERFAKIVKLLTRKDELKPLTARSLSVAELGFKGNQLPKEMLEKLTTMGGDRTNS
jgi:predicted small lipoprotein YifL